MSFDPAGPVTASGRLTSSARTSTYVRTPSHRACGGARPATAPEPAGRRALVLVLALGLLAGCGPAGHADSANDVDRLAPANLYPLAQGNIWTYDIDTETGLPSLGIMRVVAVEGSHFVVQQDGADRALRYELRPDGIYREDFDVYLLQAPIAVGAEWPAPSGRTARVTSITDAIDTSEGRLEGCVRVDEEGGEAERFISTTFCPGVGIARMQSGIRAHLTGMTARVTSVLRAHAFPE